MYNMNQELRNHIGEQYDGSFWTKESNLYNRDDEAWQLYKFEETVEFDGKQYWVVIIEKWNLDPEDIEVVESTEMFFEKYIEL